MTMDSSNRTRVGNHWIGSGSPVFVIAEIGINHNGSIDLAKKMIDGAVRAGCTAVKFQKRTPEICVPAHQQNIERDTPWGRISYLEYRRKVEFGFDHYAEIDRYCKDQNILWFASCWDVPSVEFMKQFDIPLYKISSAALTDAQLLASMKHTGTPVMISTGMSTMEEIDRAVGLVGEEGLLIAHTTSAYPCSDEELNLRMIPVLQDRYPRAIVGYSGHEVGLPTTVAAVAMGAQFVERHCTLERTMWGTDQAASVEMHGMEILVRNIRCVEKAMGDGVKKLYPSELAAKSKMRRPLERPVEMAV